uniref:Ribonuclease H-like domain-containing protein n=1 Tax=Tanacetum cinerariifolium TaxID=118510 RepID=A0A699SFM4_TANCI|nr:ribonuclease H-like domain-containing protein [Tanacetum cinerariifolium]
MAYQYYTPAQHLVYQPVLQQAQQPTQHVYQSGPLPVQQGYLGQSGHLTSKPPGQHVLSGQPGPNSFHVVTLPDPVPRNWNMDTGAISHLNDSVYSLSDVLNMCISPSVLIGDGYSILVTNSDHSILPFFIKDFMTRQVHQHLGHPVSDALRHILSSNSISYTKEKPPVCCHAC